MIDKLTAYTIGGPQSTVYATPLTVTLTRRDLSELPELNRDGELANTVYRGGDGEPDLYGLACILGAALQHAGMGHKDTAHQYLLAALYTWAELADKADAGEQVKA